MSASQTQKLVSYHCESCGARFEISRHSLAHAIAQSEGRKLDSSSSPSVKGHVLCPVDQKPLVEVTA